MNTIYELFQKEKQTNINQFYRAHKYIVSCSRRDEIWVARVSTTIVACGFIRPYVDSCKSQSYRLLRSVLVSPEYRSQGVASKLLSTIFINDHPETYTLCVSELIPLYRKFGFEVVTGNIENEALPKAWQKEIKKGLNLLLRPSAHS